MMYFSKEELELIRELLQMLFNDGFGGDREDALYDKVNHQLEDME